MTALYHVFEINNKYKRMYTTNIVEKIDVAMRKLFPLQIVLAIPAGVEYNYATVLYTYCLNSTCFIVYSHLLHMSLVISIFIIVNIVDNLQCL